MTWLKNFKSPEGQLARWIEKLQEYKFTIIHRPGRKHNNADALSRAPCQQCGRSDIQPVATITSANITGGFSLEEMRQLQLDDNTIGQLLRAKETNQKPTDAYTKAQGVEYRHLSQQWDQLAIRDGLLWRYFMHPNQDQSWLQLVVPKQIRPLILEELHQGIGSGHLGQEKTLGCLKERFYWPGHFSDVHNWCESCISCTTRKTPTPGRRAALGTIAAGYPMQIIATDLVGPLPESDNKNKYILVVADYFTHWVEAFPLPNQEACTVATKLVDEIFLRFAVPEQLHSDQGRQFEAQVITEICKLLKIHKTHTTPYHPRGDGLVERFNRTLLNMLAICAKDHPFDWEHHIRPVCMAYNSSVQSSTSYTPFYLMFGHQARLPVDIMYRPIEQQVQSYGEYAKLLKNRLQTAFDLVKQHVTKAHQHQKEFYDQKIHGKPYTAGDLVWLHSPVPKRESCRKLHHPWTGPFKVLKQLSDTTYRIQHLHGNRQRKVIHFDRLKPCTNGVTQIDHEQQTTQDDNQPTNSTATSAKLPSMIGTNLELLDDDHDQPTPASGSTSSPSSSGPPPAERRYPIRSHHPPTRYDDFLRH